ETYTLSLHDALPILSRKAAIALRSTLAIWSPQEEERRWNTETRSEASKFFSSSEWAERILKPTEYSSSEGSTRMTSSTRLDGMIDRKSTRLNSSHRT